MGDKGLKAGERAGGRERGEDVKTELEGNSMTFSEAFTRKWSRFCPPSPLPVPPPRTSKSWTPTVFPWQRFSRKWSAIFG